MVTGCQVLVLGAWCWVPVLVLGAWCWVLPVLVLVLAVRVLNAQCYALAPTCIVHRTHARGLHLAPAPRTEHPFRLRPRLLMHISRERLDVLERSHWQNPMTKIENVPGPATRSGQYIVSGA
jgi:hypothetical protein